MEEGDEQVSVSRTQVRILQIQLMQEKRESL
jgi:hypothetical protein